MNKVVVQLHSFLTSNYTEVNSHLHEHSPLQCRSRTRSKLKTSWMASNSSCRLLNINTFPCKDRTKIFDGPACTLVTIIKESIFRCFISVSSKDEEQSHEIQRKEHKLFTKERSKISNS